MDYQDDNESPGPYDFCFPGQMRGVLFAPSGGGKTTFMVNFILNGDELLKNPFKQVLFYYWNYQPLYELLREKLKNDIVFIQGEPNLDELTAILTEAEDPLLLVFDDFTQHLTKDIATIYTRLSHHYNCHVLLSLHNFFSKSPHARDITQSANALVLFKNPRDMTFANTLGGQIMPHRHTVFTDIYQRATEKIYGYLFVNLHQETPEPLRYVSNIFPNELPIRVFKCKKKKSHGSN